MGIRIKTPQSCDEKFMLVKQHKSIIKNIVWRELEILSMGKNKYIEFEWGRKRFKIRRIR